MTDINDDVQKDYNVSDNNVPNTISVCNKAISPTDQCKLVVGQTKRKKTKKEELQEPMKPLSPYTLYFRDTVSAIKQQNPNNSFKELTRIVASMWDVLDPLHKEVYVKKHQIAFTEYLNEMQIYRQQLEELEKKQDEKPKEPVIHKKIVPVMVKLVPIKKVMSQQIQRKQIVIKSGENQSQIIQLQAKPDLVMSSVSNTNNNPTNTSNTTSVIDSNSASTSSAAETLPATAATAATVSTTQKCTREKCANRAIINPDWEDEYCSNECVVTHCRDVFNTWVQSNLTTAQPQNNKT